MNRDQQIAAEGGMNMPRIVVVSLCILILATQAFPQSVDLATLSGHIEDPSGAAVAGTVVQLLHVDRNQSSEFKSDSQGRFRFPYLPVGEYEVRVQQPVSNPSFGR